MAGSVLALAYTPTSLIFTDIDCIISSIDLATRQVTTLHHAAGRVSSLQTHAADVLAASAAGVYYNQSAQSNDESLSVAVSEDGSIAAYGTADNCIHVLAYPALSRTTTIPTTHAVHSLAISGDGKRIVAGCGEGVMVYAVCGDAERQLGSHTGPVVSVVYAGPSSQ